MVARCGSTTRVRTLKRQRGIAQEKEVRCNSNRLRAPTARSAGCPFVAEWKSRSTEERITPAVPSQPPRRRKMSLMTPGATKITRAELSSLQTPSSTDTFKPVPHHELVSALEEALHFRHIEI